MSLVSELRLSVNKRQVLITLDSWSIEEAGFYFSDCDSTEKYEEIHPDFLDLIVPVQQAIVDDFCSNQRLFKKYQVSPISFTQAITTKVTVRDLMSWVKQRWKKHFPNREYPVLFNLYKKELGFKEKKITEFKKVDSKETDVIDKIQEKCEMPKALNLTEEQTNQLAFILSKDIRIDLLIELIYQAYQIAWCQDEEPRYKKNEEIEPLIKQNLLNRDNFSAGGKYSELPRDRMDVFLCHLIRTQQYRNYQSYLHWEKNQKKKSGFVN